MKILFLCLVGLFQFFGALQPVQGMVNALMQTGLVKNPVIVFVALALAIIVFECLCKFMPGFAGKFQAFEDRVKGIFTGVSAPGSNDLADLTLRLSALEENFNKFLQLAQPAQTVLQGAAAGQDALNALATGQTGDAAPQAAPAPSHASTAVQ